MEIINYNDKINEIKMEDITFHGVESNSDDFIEIVWNLLYGCNYRCSYCYGQDTLSQKDFTDINILKSVVGKIFKLKKNKYIFTLLGGEVTYHPHFLELVKHIYSYDKNVSILLVTNASKDIEYFKKMISYIGNNQFNISISLHFEYAYIEHIKNLIKLFDKYPNISLEIRFMLHPEYKEKIKNYFEELINLKKEYSFSLYLLQLREPPDFNNLDKRYDEEFISWIDNAQKIILDSNSYKSIKKNSIFPNGYYQTLNDTKISIDDNIALRNNMKKFIGFYCCAGINVIHIQKDGMYRSALCPQAKYIGNIYLENDINIYKLTNFIICNQSQCGCETNNKLNKYRDINKAKEYVLNYRKKYSEVIIENLLNAVEELENKTNNNTKNIIDTLAWWIPFKKKREEFRAKFKI